MSKIPWCDETWNVTAGCSKVSEGCKNCYAEKMAARLAAIEYHKLNNHLTPHLVENRIKKYMRVIKNGWNGEVVCDESALDKPLHWKKPRRIFVNSMSDLFHKKVPFEFIDKVFAVMGLCPQHTFQVLTKRPERALEYFLSKRVSCVMAAARDIAKGHGPKIMNEAGVIVWPLPNVHFGVSVELQKYTPRIEDLLKIPAAKRFVSFEPLLEKVKPNNIKTSERTLNALKGKSKYYVDGNTPYYGHSLDYIIIGAESINGAAGRECKLEWVESLVEQAKAAGVPCGVKQIHVGGKLLKYNKKERSWPDAWPKHLRIWEI